MLTLLGQRDEDCSSVSRREFLRVGGLGLGGLSGLGMGLGLADVLRLQAQAAERSGAAAAGGSPPRRGKSVIMVCLQGGPSHLEMYDMKPDAPVESRGEFSPIASRVPGFEVCEFLPKHAELTPHLSVVRSLRMIQPNHDLHEVLTGFPTEAARPAFGACVSRLLGPDPRGLPRYMTLAKSEFPRSFIPAEDPRYVGLAHGAFEPAPETLHNLGPDATMTAARLDDRRGLLTQLDQLRRDLDLRGNLAGSDSFAQQALALLTSPQVRAAFDLSQEPASVHELYGPERGSDYNYQFGHTWTGPKFLLARRLAEAGVPVITMAGGAWDHHGNLNGVRGTIFERMRERLPHYDHSIHALVSDLQQRGLDQDVLVVVWGEFGRTPRVNQYGGRDHWTPASFALFAGGGLRMGQVIGATDRIGGQVVSRAYGAQNVLAMVYRHLGIDPGATIRNFAGRPVSLLDTHEPIRELIS